MIRKPAAIVLVTATGLLAIALVPAAFAGKGGSGQGGGGKPSSGTSTVSLKPLESPDVPHYSQRVTFDVYTTATAYPYVTLRCYQNGGLVYKMSNAMFATSLNQIFTLGPTPNWTGGAANCTADLESWSSRKITRLASTSFDVHA